jgi:hypothetical protein
MWLDSFAHVRPRDAERLGAAGIRNGDDLLDRLANHGRLMTLARESGIDEQRLPSFAVQAQFQRLRAPAVAARTI